MMTNILTNQYWDYGKAPDIRFTLAYDMQRVGTDMQYKFKWTIHSLNTPNSGFGWPIYATISLDGVTKLSGITVKASQPIKWYGTELTYESAWVAVPNKENGSTAFRMTMFSGSGMERSQTWTSTLAVADLSSSFSVSDFEFGSSVTVNINKAKETYHHTVKLEIGNRSYSLENVNDTYSYEVPEYWADQTPNASETNAVISVTTYDGSSKVGNTQTKTVKAIVPESIAPSLSVNETVVDGIGVSYLSGISKVKLDATASGIFGSTIKNIEFAVGTEKKSGTATSFTSGILTQTTRSYSVTATDSRGRSKTYNQFLLVRPYTPPSISNVVVRRCNSEGTFSEGGTSVYIKADAQKDPVIAGNELTVTASYRELDLYFGEGVEIPNGVGSVQFENLISLQKSYEIKITATDTTGNSAEYIVLIPSSTNFMLTAKGRKFCFGGYLDETKGNGLQVTDNLYVGGRLFAPTTFDRLLNENVEAGGVRFPSTDQVYSFFVIIVNKTNNVGGRHTEYIPAIYIDVERVFSPYISDGHKDIALTYTNGSLTVKNQSPDALRIVVYGVV